ncbi:hypothetical protein ACFYTG_32340 [Streptomyces mirabilis]|uniref:hypothetical protein n=1 Tax=Streptomyces mirabilis TaxID=68239 RepID=UPI003678F7CA
MNPRIRSLLTTLALAATATLVLTGCSDTSVRHDQSEYDAHGAKYEPGGGREAGDLEQLAAAVGCAGPRGRR